jgi:rod shape-determining protein MreC
MRIQGTDTPGPRPGWLILFIALSIVLMTVWFREGDTGPLHKVRVGVQTVTAPVGAAGEWVSRPFSGFFSWVGDLGVSRSQLEQLRLQNERLRSRVAVLEEARLENVRLRGLIRIQQAKDLETLGAHVIGRPTNSWDGIITIDRGSSDGVKRGMPVVGARGLLGQTISVAKGSSKVRLITDQRSGVASMVQRNRAEGVAKGTLSGGLTLDFVSVESTVKAGDVVITSGMGGIYPKGLVVGEVKTVDRRSNSLYQVIDVDPAASAFGLEDVLVLTGAPPAVVPEGGE